MADLLDRWEDAVFGSLIWDAGSGEWVGQMTFRRRAVRLLIDPDRTAPTAEEQVAVFEPARRLFAGLADAEPGLRWQATFQIAAAVAEQDEEAELPTGAFADDLEAEAIALHASGGSLYYRSPRFFPGQRVTIFFDQEL